MSRASEPGRQSDTAFASSTLIACGQIGYYNCPTPVGGCCPLGLVCGEVDCTLPSETQTGSYPGSVSLTKCIGHNGYFVCPESLGGDCCPFGYLCDTVVQCRLTLKLNENTLTYTTTVGKTIENITTTIRLGPSVTAADRLPTATNTLGSNKSRRSNLSGPQIGGIVGGVLGSVLLLFAAVFLLFRYRRRRQAATDEASGGRNQFEKQELDTQGVSRAELASNTDDKLQRGYPGHELFGIFEGHELAGSYEAHGFSELEGAPRERPS